MDPPTLDRTWLCTVLFMDIVGYSMNSDQIQGKLKERFTRYVSEAIRDVAEDHRVILDTGDGAAICFLGAPEAAMFTALKLRSSFVHDAAESDPGLKVRIGINLGPVKLIRDINDSLNAIGDGINTGQRVMTFAGENQVLVSRSFFEVISCLADGYQQLFRYEGTKKDKHVREHVIYQLIPPGQEAPAAAAPRVEIRHEPENEPALPPASVREDAPAAAFNREPEHEPENEPALPPASVREDAPAAAFNREPEYEPENAAELPPAFVREGTVELIGPVSFDPQMLESLRALLAPLLGPIAGHLVKRSARQARDADGLVRELASYIPQPGSRAKFLAQAGRRAGIAADSAQQFPVPVLAPLSAPAKELPWDADWLEKARKELAAHIGPMARVLVERTAKRAASRKEFCDVLSAELPVGARERFRNALGVVA
jgi:class 3 adenylate cyclase